MKISTQEYQELKSSLEINEKIIFLLRNEIQQKDDTIKLQSLALEFQSLTLKRAAALIEKLGEPKTN